MWWNWGCFIVGLATSRTIIIDDNADNGDDDDDDDDDGGDDDDEGAGTSGGDDNNCKKNILYLENKNAPKNNSPNAYNNQQKYLISR